MEKAYCELLWVGRQMKHIAADTMKLSTGQATSCIHSHSTSHSNTPRRL